MTQPLGYGHREPINGPSRGQPVPSAIGGSWLIFAPARLGLPGTPAPPQRRSPLIRMQIHIGHSNSCGTLPCISIASSSVGTMQAPSSALGFSTGQDGQPGATTERAGSGSTPGQPIIGSISASQPRFPPHLTPARRAVMVPRTALGDERYCPARQGTGEPGDDAFA